MARRLGQVVGVGEDAIRIAVAGAIGDSYIHFGAADVLVPFASGWRPIAIAWGVVSAYLLAAVELTSLLRKRLSKRAWRAVHFASFPLFVTATLHGVTAGTEGATTIGVAVAALVTSIVAGLTAYRVIDAREQAAHPPAPRVPRPPRPVPSVAASPRTPSNPRARAKTWTWPTSKTTWPVSRCPRRPRRSSRCA